MDTLRVQRFLRLSLVFSLLLTGVGGIFVYQASPLRDPNFQPNHANAGSLLPELRHWTDFHWLVGATLLAILLATPLIGLLYSWSLPQSLYLARSWQRGLSPEVAKLTFIMFWVSIWVLVLGSVWLLFLAYLLNQWLVD